jgi:hypothetical protein
MYKNQSTNNSFEPMTNSSAVLSSTASAVSSVRLVFVPSKTRYSLNESFHVQSLSLDWNSTRVEYIRITFTITRSAVSNNYHVP